MHLRSTSVAHLAYKLWSEASLLWAATAGGIESWASGAHNVLVQHISALGLWPSIQFNPKGLLFLLIYLYSLILVQSTFPHNHA